jgi:hypothetical protein
MLHWGDCLRTSTARRQAPLDVLLFLMQCGCVAAGRSGERQLALHDRQVCLVSLNLLAQRVVLKRMHPDRLTERLTMRLSPCAARVVGEARWSRDVLAASKTLLEMSLAV